MTAPKRRPWPTTPKMPRLVDGQITPDQLLEAFTVLKADGPDESMTLAEVIDWLSLHVQRPHPPTSSNPPGARGARIRKRYGTPAGRPGRLRRVEASAAA